MIIRRSPRAFIYRPGQPPILVRGGGGSGGGGGGVTDHGALTGLTDDDHSQYALADGSRGNFASPAQGAKADTATQPADLASAISTHAAASDPHGDRAYTDSNFAPLRMTYQAFSDINAGEFVVLVNGTTWAKADASTVATCFGIIGRAEATVLMGEPLSALVRGVVNLGLIAIDGTGETVFISATTPGAIRLGPPPAIGRMIGFIQLVGFNALLYFDGAANVPLLGTGTGMAVSAADTRVTAQDTSTWEAGVGTSETVVSPAKVAAAIAALGGGGGSPGGSTNELQRNDGGSFAGATGVTWASNQLLITAQAAATVPLAVKAAAAHTANILEAQNSSGTEVFGVRSDAALKLWDSGVAHPPTIQAASVGYGGAGAIYFGGRTVREKAVGMSWTGHQGSVHLNSSGALYWSSSTDALLYPPATAIMHVAAGIVGIRGFGAGGSLSFIEQTAPSAPAANGVYIYAEDNGAGKTRLMALFATGAAQQIAIEP